MSPVIKVGRQVGAVPSGSGGRWWSVEEVAAYLLISVSSVRRLVKEGKIEAYKVGKQWRFQREAVDACITVSRKEGM